MTRPRAALTRPASAAIRRLVDEARHNETGMERGRHLRNGVNRLLDQYVQAQLRTETSGASFASLRSARTQPTMMSNPNGQATKRAIMPRTSAQRTDPGFIRFDVRLQEA